MTEYNRWMNEKVYAACATLSDEERKRDRGAFFKSIHATLNHLVWADNSWLARFERRTWATAPLGQDTFTDFEALRAARAEMDEELLAWGRSVTPEWLNGSMTLVSKIYRFTQDHPRWVLVTQMFNHQTHHRGQVHAMLTAAGVDVGPTDLPVLPFLRGTP
jgi:uncharacterized damage-inducible protein DinB